MKITVNSMIISFFEEFLTKNNLEKIKLVTWSTKLYLAARSLQEFNKVKAMINSKNIKEFIYWPILERNEGYWISPWSDPQSLERLFGDIKERKNQRRLDVLLDLEPPLKRSRLFNIEDFNQNKREITKFIRDANGYNVSISTVEKSYIPDWVLEPLGLSFAPEEYGNRKITMYYSSYRRRFLPDLVVDKLYERKVIQYARKKTLLGLGLIASGIHDEKHRTTPEKLQREIEIASSHGIEEVIIFRLDGLNDDYLRAIHRDFVNKT